MLVFFSISRFCFSSALSKKYLFLFVLGFLFVCSARQRNARALAHKLTRYHALSLYIIKCRAVRSQVSNYNRRARARALIFCPTCTTKKTFESFVPNERKLFCQLFGTSCACVNHRVFMRQFILAYSTPHMQCARR